MLRLLTSCSPNAAFILLGLAATLNVTSANIIGVDISGNSKQEHKVEDDPVVLLDPVLRLNRYTFEKAILEEHADEVPHWIVLFCPPWYEPCQALEPLYRKLTEKWQDQLNNALLSTEVRFAAVDCATEKALCNTQNVETYPFVSHYHRRKQVKNWKGKSFQTDEKRLRDFLQKELGPVAAAVAAASPQENDNMQDVTAEEGMTIPVDFLLIFAAIAGNAFFISRGGIGSQAATPETSPLKGGPAMMAGSAMPSGSQAESRAACVARVLPQEWARDRNSIEL